MASSAMRRSASAAASTAAAAAAAAAASPTAVACARAPLSERSERGRNEREHAPPAVYAFRQLCALLRERKLAESIGPPRVVLLRWPIEHGQVGLDN